MVVGTEERLKMNQARSMETCKKNGEGKERFTIRKSKRKA
jgi:hypothetical protein